LNHTKNFLEELILLKKSTDIQFSLIVKKNQYKLDDVIIFKKIDKKGKIIRSKEKNSESSWSASFNFVYQIKAVIHEPMLAKTLSSVMLGPNYKFEELEICINGATENLNSVLLVVNLINSIQKKSRVELTMNIIKIIQK
jgi:superfamily II helicase